MRERSRLARCYLRGSGIEIGALHNPLPVPRELGVTYVDRLPIEELRRHYPELSDFTLAPVDVLDDGERLTQFADASQDFVIACHFLEHAQDPIGALKAQLRVLKPGGVLFLAVPDRRHTFDRRRPPTSWEHVCRDHLEGPAWSYEDHLHDYAALVEGHAGSALAQRVRQLRELCYSIHFHVWDAQEFADFLERFRAEFEAGCRIAEYRCVGEENLSILCKDAADAVQLPLSTSFFKS